MPTLSAQDLLFMADASRRHWLQLTTNTPLDQQRLNDLQLLMLAHYMAAIDLLVRQGVLKNGDVPAITLLTSDSNPPEYDYE